MLEALYPEAKDFDKLDFENKTGSFALQRYHEGTPKLQHDPALSF
jgi:hypothetical protein